MIRSINLFRIPIGRSLQTFPREEPCVRLSPHTARAIYYLVLYMHSYSPPPPLPLPPCMTSHAAKQLSIKV